ncbi:DUF4190 domain-containing protein [Kitasatospora sp. NPDC057198]|uniref:DUF4190 domain-containing protein n=1 Tax=Kitasatospora sp. NPDC057198 TaxID=3346046 RepID=UPI003627F5E8
MPFDQERPGNEDPDGARDDAPAAPPALSLEKPAPAPPAVSFAKPGIPGGDFVRAADADAGAGAPAPAATAAAAGTAVDAARSAAEEATVVQGAPAAPAPTTVEPAVPEPAASPWARPAAPTPPGVPQSAPAPAAVNPWAAPTGSTPPGAPQAVPGPAPAAVNPWAAPTGVQQAWGSGAVPPQPGTAQYPAQAPGPYGMPGYPVYPQPSRSAYANGLAIAALVVSFLCYLGIIAIGLGAAALVQIRRTGERGKGMAVSGIVIGSAWLVLLVLVIVNGGFHFQADTDRSSGGLSSVSPLRLNAGDCADLGFKTAVKKADCSVSHNAEVFWSSVSTATGGYPGAEALQDEADRLCSRHLDEYVMDMWSIPETTDYPAAYPDQDTWNVVGGRQIVCFLKSDKPTTGSLRKDSSNLTSDQVQFLEATNEIDRLWVDVPDEDLDVADNPGAFRSWARELAAGADAQAAALGAAHWRGVDQATVGKLVQETAVASQHFRAAAVADDSDTVEDELLAGYQHLGEDYILDLRRALELTTQDEEPAKRPSEQVV